MRNKIIAVIVLLLLSDAVLRAQNPIIQTKFTADPAPMVYHDTVYLYTGHDEEYAPAGYGGFRMKDWLCYTSTDMVNWTDRGAVATLRNFKWADKAVSGWGGFDNGAWALQVIERGGKFYMYCPVQGRGIGVLVADNPLGPFVDPLGKPLIDGNHDSIDPTVFIDEDGQAYLYWGNPNLWYVRLNKDMVSYSGEMVKDSSIAKVKGQKDPYHYQEGPWAFRRNGNYYMAYASTCCPEGIGYSMSKSAAGPWEFKGYIMKPNGQSSGNHPGIIDYKGRSYVFGFNYQLNYKLTSEHHERRSVCVAEFQYNPDGTIPELPWWGEEGIRPNGTLDPFATVQAETMAWGAGVKTARDSVSGGMYVTGIDSGDYIKVRGVDFGKGARKFGARVKAGFGAGSGSTVGSGAGGVIEVRVDSLAGEMIGICRVRREKGIWGTVSCKVKKIMGVRDVYLVFKGAGGELFDFDSWRLVRS